MNEYSRGFLDALGWVLNQIEELDDGSSRALGELRRKIRDLIEAVVRTSGRSLAAA